jgi:hypothetical protein
VHLSRLLLPIPLALYLSCASTYYDRYRSAHPGWEPDFPKLGVGVDEAVASLYAPLEHEKTHAIVKRLRILGLGSEPWETIPEAALEDGSFRPDPARLYVVATEIDCFWSDRRVGYWSHGEAFAWYLFQELRLAAWRHVVFDRFCRSERKRQGSVHSVPGFEEKLRELLEAPPTPEE